MRKCNHQSVCMAFLALCRPRDVSVFTAEMRRGASCVRKAIRNSTLDELCFLWGNMNSWYFLPMETLTVFWKQMEAEASGFWGSWGAGASWFCGAVEAAAQPWSRWWWKPSLCSNLTDEPGENQAGFVKTSACPQRSYLLLRFCEMFSFQWISISSFKRGLVWKFRLVLLVNAFKENLKLLGYIGQNWCLNYYFFF